MKGTGRKTINNKKWEHRNNALKDVSNDLKENGRKFAHIISEKNKKNMKADVTEGKHVRKSYRNESEEINGNSDSSKSSSDISESGHHDDHCANIVSEKKLEFEIFNHDYDYILFITVMQILLQKQKNNKQENTILTFNIDKLIKSKEKNKEENIHFLSLLLLSIYDYKNGLLYLCKKMNKFDISFLFSIHVTIEKHEEIYLQKMVSLLNKNSDSMAEKEIKNNSITEQSADEKEPIVMLQKMRKQLYTQIYNTCLEYFKLNPSFYMYIFYYLSSLKEDEYLMNFLRVVKTNSDLTMLYIISLLKKYNKNYECIKQIILSYISEMNEWINKKIKEIEKDKKELCKIKQKQLKKRLKYTVIDNIYCSLCKEMLTKPTIHFFCKHSFHMYCVNNHEICILCNSKENEKKLLKEKAISVNSNFDEFFKYLQGSTDKFAFISNYLANGISLSSSITPTNKKE